MSKITKSVLGGLLFTCWLMCFVFPISLLQTFSDHTPIDTFLGQQVINFFVLWIICGVVAHGVIGMFDEINKRRPEDRHDQTDNDKNAKNQTQGDQSGNSQTRNDQTDGVHKSDHADNGPKQ